MKGCAVIAPLLKKSLLRLNRFSQTMEKWNLVTYEDKIELRRPLYHREILLGQAGQDLVAERLEGREPLMIARLGSVELSALSFYLQKRQVKTPYPKAIATQMRNNAGFFPVSDDSLDTFARCYLEHLKEVDVLAVWFNPYEDVICNRCCADAELVELGCLEPFHFDHPWSARLAGKKVLVIHPFAESIRRQYAEKRRLLFPSPDVLPEFELKTLKAVQSIAGSEVAFPTWFDAYRHMCDQMSAVDFDVCLIGAGAYGLPLAYFAKQMGKQAIHLGGVTQILFGIMGKRWEELYADSTAKLFNEHWIRPLQSETPQHKERVENGCYW